MPKPTNSKDGKLRFTVIVKFRIGFYELYYALIDKVEYEQVPAALKIIHKQRRMSLRRLAVEMAKHDSSKLSWFDHDVDQRICEAADKKVRELYPELEPDPEPMR